MVAAVFAIVAALLALRITRQNDGDADALFRSSILPPEHVTLSTAAPAGGLALSPDGHRLVSPPRKAMDR